MIRIGVHIPLPGPFAATWSPSRHRRHRSGHPMLAVGSLALVAAAIAAAVHLWIYLAAAALFVVGVAFMIAGLRARNAHRAQAATRSVQHHRSP